MFRYGGFADEICADLDGQIAGLKEAGCDHLDLRGVDGKGVLDLSDEDVLRIRKRLKEEGVKVSSIGSPIGKIKPTDPFEPHLDRFKRALDLADQFEAPYVRVFSFFVGPEERKKYRDDIMKKISRLAKVSKGRRAICLHENEGDVYGDNVDHVNEVLEAAEGTWKLIFDPGNFVWSKVRPFDEAYPLQKDLILQVHVKDHNLGDNAACVAGEGEGQIPQLFKALKATGREYILSLEPHLKSEGKYSGWSGKDKFLAAAKAMHAVVKGA